MHTVDWQVTDVIDAGDDTETALRCVESSRLWRQLYRRAVETNNRCSTFTHHQQQLQQLHTLSTTAAAASHIINNSCSCFTPAAASEVINSWADYCVRQFQIISVIRKYQKTMHPCKRANLTAITYPYCRLLTLLVIMQSSMATEKSWSPTTLRSCTWLLWPLPCITSQSPVAAVQTPERLKSGR